MISLPHLCGRKIIMAVPKIIRHSTDIFIPNCNDFLGCKTIRLKIIVFRYRLKSLVPLRSHSLHCILLLFSPIIVFEKRKPAVESKRKPVKDVPMKKEKAKPVPAVVLQDSSGANTQRSIGATEEIIKTDRSFPSEIMTKLEKLDHVSPREIEPTIDQGRNSKEQPAAESPEPVHLTLLERKKLKWELEKRESFL